MIYKFDNDSLTYKKVTGRVLLKFMSILVLITSITSFVLIDGLKTITNSVNVIVLREDAKANEFSPGNLKAYIKYLNIQYPDIVYAQSQIETGNFSSSLFREQHNLFGMKVSNARPSTNRGGENGNAAYSNWKESVQDYAMFESRCLTNIKTRDEYFEYLKENYAEDTSYVTKIKEIIKESGK